mgnify:CR=1 FL=1
MLLTLQGVGLAFGAEEVFSGVSLTVDRGDRAALVGVNGAGKSSLMKIAAGLTEPTLGSVSRADGLRTAYLPQRLSEFPRGPLRETVCRLAGPVFSAMEEMESVSAALAEPDCDERERSRLMGRLSRLQDVLAAHDAYTLDSRAGAILHGLGFEEEDMERELSSLSGGWRMRAQLAILLLSAPDFLLLDEPTNHLDLEARLWLEEFLSSFQGAVWLTSHDPSFLDRTVDRIHELEFGEMSSYGGSYSFYERRKREEEADRRKRAKHADELRQRLERFINRWKAKPGMRRMVESRRKMLERVEVVRTHREPGHLRLGFQAPRRSPRVVVEASGLCKGYSDPVICNVDMVLERGEKVGLIGRNGGGKSTLSRLLAGREEPDSGDVHRGSGVSLGYYSQDVESRLDPDRTVLEQLSDLAPGRAEADLRSLLGSFLFTGDDVFKPTGVLSGGEKARVALARLMLGSFDLLILDEPTNHLDIFSRDALQEALEDYHGTLLLVSHDERLIDSVTDSILLLESRELKRWSGSFSSYLEDRRQRIRSSMAGSGRERTGGNRRDRRRREAKQRNRRYRDRRGLEEEMESVADELDPLMARQSELEGLLSDPQVLSVGSRVESLRREHGTLQRKIERLERRWDELAEALEEL